MVASSDIRSQYPKQLLCYAFRFPVVLERIHNNDGIKRTIDERKTVGVSQQVSVPEYCRFHLDHVIKALRCSTSAEIQNKAIASLVDNG